MDVTFWIILLAYLVISDYVSGLTQLKPLNLTVEIWDGDAMLFWELPKEAPSPVQYQVQMGRYGVVNSWFNVTRCGNTQLKHCNLNGCIEDYNQLYRVRVRLITSNGTFPWVISKRFNPKDTKLHFPSSTVLVTSTSVTVRVYRKPLLKRIYPFGLLYTVYLQEGRLENKTTIQTLKVDGDENEAEVRFGSLRWGREYCVTLKVEGNGGMSHSRVSPEKCIILPEQEWYIVAIVSFALLSGIVVLALGTCFFLWRPSTMPASLKSINSGWHPLSVGEIPVEVVLDKGWIISRPTTTPMDWEANDQSAPAVRGGLKEELDRKSSLDSGVSSRSHISGMGGEGSSARQEDSGCESLGAPDSVVSSSSSGGTKGSRADGDISLTEDSGMGLGCQSGSAVSLRGEDFGLLPEALSVAGDCYRSQSPSSVDGHVTETTCDPVPEYQSGHLACICSGAGQCLWCQAGRHYKSGVDGQAVACGGFPADQVFRGDLTCEMESAFFGYKKNELDIETVEHLEGGTNLGPFLICTGESFPLLAALSEYPLVEEELDGGGKTISLSLGDLKVTFD